MVLIRSISGIRGIIGARPGEGLTPVDIVKYTSAYACFLNRCKKGDENLKVIIGRDARHSGQMISAMVSSTFAACGIDVIDLGLTTTPTVEIAVTELKADGGIVITASHNPKQWNALKLLNRRGEFLSEKEADEVFSLAEGQDFIFVSSQNLGKYDQDDTFIRKHIEKISELPLVDVEAIRKAKFCVAVDCVNSSGGIAVPMLLEMLGVSRIETLFCEPNGEFPHNPEPLSENLTELSALVVKSKANVGFAVDPDVDRLAIVMEDGEMFGEEYTLVAVADYVLQHKTGPAVSNLSSTIALHDVTAKHGGNYFASAVGEVNVIKMMKAKKAVIGGEGNGGVIYPDLHYGRDALVAIALFLSYLARSGKRCSALRNLYPNYYISKNKITLAPEMDMEHVFQQIKEKYQKQPINTSDGIRIEFDKEWVHLRKSNTEPVIRVYSESDSIAKAETLAHKLIGDIKEIIKIKTNGFSEED
ncbi:MAG: phosphoglucosamine mutase [Bacteroidetes bacterium]|nr:phosphoglucosamine mutase [Bacteroidota bacterium]